MGLWSYSNKHNRMYDSIWLHRQLGYFLGKGEYRYEPWGSSTVGDGVWFSHWFVISIDTGHTAQSPQSGPR